MLLDNYRLAEQVQQYCYLAPGVINVWIRPTCSTSRSIPSRLAACSTYSFPLGLSTPGRLSVLEGHLLSTFYLSEVISRMPKRRTTMYHITEAVYSTWQQSNHPTTKKSSIGLSKTVISTMMSRRESKFTWRMNSTPPS